MDAQGALFSYLISDNAFTALLATYTPAGGVAGPALFTNEIPEDFVNGVLPCGVIDAPNLNDREPTASERYRDIACNIRFYHIPAGSNKPLLDAAEAAGDSLDLLSSFAYGDDTYVDTTVTGPVRAPTTNPSADGVVLSARLNVKES